MESNLARWSRGTARGTSGGNGNAAGQPSHPHTQPDGRLAAAERTNWSGDGGGRHAAPRLNVSLTGIDDASAVYDSLGFAAFASPAISGIHPETRFRSPVSPTYGPEEWQGLGRADAPEMFRMSPASPGGSGSPPGIYLPHAPAAAPSPTETFRTSPASPGGGSGSTPGIYLPHAPAATTPSPTEMFRSGSPPGIYLPHAPAATPSPTNGLPYIHVPEGNSVVLMRTPPPSDGEDASLGSSRSMTPHLARPGSPLSQASPFTGPSPTDTSLDALFNILNSPLAEAAGRSPPGFVGGVGRNAFDGSLRSSSPGHYNTSGQVPAGLGAVPAEVASERPPLSICLSPEGMYHEQHAQNGLFPFGAGGSAPGSPVGTSPAASVAGLVGNPPRKGQQPWTKTDDPSRKMFPCDAPGCHKNFKRAEHLTRHFHSVHTSEKPFRCPISTCGKHFSRSDNMNQHLQTHKSKGRQTPREKKATNLLQDLDYLLSMQQSELATQFYPAQQSFSEREHLQQRPQQLHPFLEEAGQQLMLPAERAHDPMQILLSPTASAAGYNLSPQFDHLTFQLDHMDI